MGHELVPTSGELPPLNELVACLKREFRYVREDGAKALIRARETAEWLERVNPAIFLGRHAEALAYAARPQTLSASDALWIEFGDGESNTLSFALWPGESIKFGYRGDDDELRAQPLLRRCARAISCNVVAF